MTKTATATKTTATHTTPDGQIFTRSTTKARFQFFVQGFRTTGYYAEINGPAWAGGFCTTRAAADKAAREMAAQGDAQVEVIAL